MNKPEGTTFWKCANLC